jgi:hypothetical protein
MIKNIAVTLATALLFACSVYAQGEYLEKGQSGFGISGGFASNEDASSFGATAGYSVKGMFDFGLSFARVSFEDELADAEGNPSELSATAISPHVTFHAIKQEPDKFPLSIALGVSYEHDSYSSDALDDFDLTLSANSWLFGGSVYSNIKMTPNFQLQPRGGVTYISTKSKLEDDAGNSISDTESTTLFGFGLSLIFKTSENNRFIVSPGVGISDDNTTFSVGAGFVFLTR